MARKNDKDKDLPGPVEGSQEIVDRLDPVPDGLVDKVKEIVQLDIEAEKDK
jgi:hypothetical protein